MHPSHEDEFFRRFVVRRVIILERYRDRADLVEIAPERRHRFDTFFQIGESAEEFTPHLNNRGITRAKMLLSSIGNRSWALVLDRSGVLGIGPLDARVIVCSL